MYVNTLTFSDSDYPSILRNLATPPRMLYWSGRHPREWLNRPKVAIVGSRKLTPYGKVITEKITSELATAGAVIISGLAYGIDITAHQAALSVRGTTVSVLPSSIEEIYPSAHAHTARHISETGTLISEYSIGSVPFKGNFIARNRIISGLADVLLIPEAALKSGSLHTARFAMEQGKTVMAVPGPVTSLTSEGCNNLIKSGAVPVTSSEDVMFALKINPAKKHREKKILGSENETKIYNLIKEGITNQDDLASVAGIPTPDLSSTLTMLEISGYIRPAGGGNWVIF
jgi:DNA processing protein